MFLHSTSLGHFNYWVQGESVLIKEIHVSSIFGDLIFDSVVAPHDKIYVSRQLVKTIQFGLKDVHGNAVVLHGTHVSLSLISVTRD